MGGKVRRTPPVLEVLPRCCRAVGRWEGRGQTGPRGELWAGRPLPEAHLFIGSLVLPSAAVNRGDWLRLPRRHLHCSCVTTRLVSPGPTLRTPRLVPPKSPGVGFCRMPAASHSCICCHSSGGTMNVFNRRKLTLQVKQVMLF